MMKWILFAVFGAFFFAQINAQSECFYFSSTCSFSNVTVQSGITVLYDFYKTLSPPGECYENYICDLAYGGCGSIYSAMTLDDSLKEDSLVGLGMRGTTLGALPIFNPNYFHPSYETRYSAMVGGGSVHFNTTVLNITENSPRVSNVLVFPEEQK